VLLAMGRYLGWLHGWVIGGFRMRNDLSWPNKSGCEQAGERLTGMFWVGKLVIEV